MLQKEEYEPKVKMTPQPPPLETQSTWARLVRTGPNIQGSKNTVRSKARCRKIAGAQAEQRTKLNTTTTTTSPKVPQAELKYSLWEHGW